MPNRTAVPAPPAQPIVQPMAQPMAARAGTYLYLYAIVAAQSLTTIPQPGLDPSQPVYLLGDGPVQALVSRVPAADFTEEQIAAGLQEITWIETYVRAHQRVLDQVVASGQTLLPLRFCTIYRDEATVQALLAARASALLAELARLGHTLEWGVKLSIALPPLQEAIMNGQVAVADQAVDQEIRTLRQRMAGVATGAAFLYKKKLETLVATHADAYAFALADESHAHLARYAMAAVTNALPPACPDLRLSAAYLVALPNVAAFRQAVEALAEAYLAFGFQYEVSGPWPPYNFLTLTFDAD